jgi:hypothetical protein
LFEWLGMSFVAEPGDLHLSEANHVAMCQTQYPDVLSEFSWGDNGAYGDQGGWAGSHYYDTMGGYAGSHYYDNQYYDVDDSDYINPYEYADYNPIGDEHNRVECPNCGNHFSPGYDACPFCGWTP